MPPNPRWGMSEQGRKMTGMDAAPHEHRDVRTQGLQGCARIATFPEGRCLTVGDELWAALAGMPVPQSQGGLCKGWGYLGR
ncbi:MAG: hypothetical protein ACR65R_07610 [Methylomicrobium sp.]